MMNPDMMNPDMMNPGADVNATILNPDMMNPDMMNADPTNAALTDTVWTLTNNGNTTAAYDVKMLLRGDSQVPDGFQTQLLLYKTYLTPVARDCELAQETQNVLIASVPNPPFGHVGDEVTFDPADGSVGHTTLWLAPGESARITLRVFDPVRDDDVVFDPVREVTPATAPQPVDTESAAAGETTPEVVTTSSIVFLARPTATPIGGFVTPPVPVLVQDENGAPVAGATVALSLAANPGGAALYGGTATTGPDGIATFDQLWLDRPGRGYRLRAAVGTATSDDSGLFDVVPLVVTSTGDSGPGTLRQAIENANRNAGRADTISFDIGGGGLRTIPLASLLPVVADALTIDATTQPGYAGVPLVRLDGAAAGTSASGLHAQGTSVTIRGLAITRFSDAGIRLDDVTGGLVEACYVGTDGTADLGNAGDGVAIQGGSTNVVRGCTTSGNGGAGIVLWSTQDDDLVGNRIGTNAAGDAAIPNDSSGILLRMSSRQRIGTGAPGSGNVISGNALYGIELSGPGAVSDVLIAGNRIGTNAAGTAALPNGLGIYVFGTDKTGITIGGATPDARNVISGNSSYGISLNTTRQVAVAGNYIGADASGATGLGNALSGVHLYSAQDSRIGGITAAESNVIAFNGGAGVELAVAGSGNAFLGNRTLSNGGLGIDIAPPGPNPNDVGDGDVGPNDMLNHPVLTSAVDNGTQTAVSGSVDVGVPGATVTIQFFHSGTCDSSGYGEGQTPVGQTTVATGTGGTATFVASLPGGLNPGTITATTVLPPANTTSEFSACRSVTGAGSGGGTLAFLSQPSAPIAGAAMVPAVQVQVIDGLGAAVPGVTVTLSLSVNLNGAVLTGASATSDAAGVATFTSLEVDRPGGCYTLSASAVGTTAAASNPFNVTGFRAGPPATARARGAAIPLGDGRILFAGGEGPDPLASADLYDPALGTYGPTGSMAEARSGHAAVRLLDGRVLVTGGMPSPTTAELYDPASGTFSPTGEIPSSRMNHSATVLADGTVLVVGGGPFGGILDRAELYDPATGLFSDSSIPMGAPRFAHTATRLPDGRVLVAGGNGLAGHAVASAELYDPASKTFSPTGPMTAERAGHRAVLLSDGRVLVVGGANDVPGPVLAIDAYDPSTGTFSAVGSLISGRTSPTATLLDGGRVLITGGLQGVDPLSSVEIFDPATGTSIGAGQLAEARSSHMAVRLPSGKVLVVGGQGAPGIYPTSTEIYVPSNPPYCSFAFTQVSAGDMYTCGVKTDGAVACWGDNYYGQGTPPPGLFTQVGAGEFHTCGLKGDGTAACWGRNVYGESTPPADSFTQVVAGGFHGCGLKGDGTVACWGRNDYGQSNAPADTFTQVSGGQVHTCGRRSDGIVACWGDDTYGQSAVPSSTFTQVSGGRWHTCGVRSDGTVACWGNNTYGQSTPPEGTFTEVSAAEIHSCGLKTDGTVACWGDETYGPITPPAGIFTQVSAGTRHTCGVKSDSAVVCWGDNTYGQSTPPTP